MNIWQLFYLNNMLISSEEVLGEVKSLKLERVLNSYCSELVVSIRAHTPKNVPFPKGCIVLFLTKPGPL